MLVGLVMVVVSVCGRVSRLWLPIVERSESVRVFLEDFKSEFRCETRGVVLVFNLVRGVCSRCVQGSALLVL